MWCTAFVVLEKNKIQEDGKRCIPVFCIY